jgi:pilus assembly protein CpaE
MAEIRATMALGSDVERKLVEDAFGIQPGITIDDFVDAGPHSLDYLDDSDAHAVVVFCRGDSPELVQFIHGAVAQRPERPVVVYYDGVPNGFVRRAFDAGAEDLVHGTLVPGNGSGPQIAFALEKAVARRGGVAGTGTGQMVTVLGPKGGTGKTLVCCNLAAAIAAKGGRTVLIDLDLQFGDIGLALGLRPDRTVYDLATSGGSLDSGKVEDFFARHESGLNVLMAPRRPDQAASVTISFLEELFAVLRETADVVIVDTPPSFAPEVITAVDASTSLLAIATLDALSLKNTRLALETLDLMSVDEEKIRVVLNRADSKVGVTLDDAGHLLGRAPDVLVPSSREISKSVNEARPVVLSHSDDDARRAFEALAHMVAPSVVGAAAAKGVRRRLLGRKRS